jgi:hypothetical protein
MLWHLEYSSLEIFPPIIGNTALPIKVVSKWYLPIFKMATPVVSNAALPTQV